MARQTSGYSSSSIAYPYHTLYLQRSDTVHLLGELALLGTTHTNDLLELEELCQGLLLLDDIGQCIAIEDRQEGIARFP